MLSTTLRVKTTLVVSTPAGRTVALLPKADIRHRANDKDLEKSPCFSGMLIQHLTCLLCQAATVELWPRCS